MRKAVGLEYEVGGNPDGEAVLLIHAGTATVYAPLMVEPALADRYRLVRFHRRGFAGSDQFDGPVTIDAFVRDSLALLEHLEIERAHVVGHSGSGVVALQLALDAPDARAHARVGGTGIGAARRALASTDARRDGYTARARPSGGLARRDERCG